MAGSMVGEPWCLSAGLNLDLLSQGFQEPELSPSAQFPVGTAHPGKNVGMTQGKRT